MDLRADLWSNLPFEIVEQVLSFVPVPVLCRYRSVCKRWNRLISNPGFGVLCNRNGKGQAPFMIMHYTRHGTGKPFQSESQGWGFLDLNARRWYLVKPSDAHEKSCRYKRPKLVMAMDGGLVACKQYTFSKWAKSPSAIFVYNPIGKTRKELPAAPNLSPGWSLLNLVVDNITQSFKLFLMSVHFEAEELKNPRTTSEEWSKILSVPFLSCYNSVTNEWRSSTNPYINFQTIAEFMVRFYPSSSVLCRGLLYVLFKSYTNNHRRVHEHQLWRYNPVEDSWENLQVLNSSRTYKFCRLIVIANRLFLVGWAYPGEDPLYWNGLEFEVSEIKILDMTCETLFVWTRAQAMEAFDKKEDAEYMLINVTGFGQSLMFMSDTTRGNMITFDVVTRSWDRDWPQNPLAHLSKGKCSWVGKEMNFLPPGLVW